LSWATFHFGITGYEWLLETGAKGHLLHRDNPGKSVDLGIEANVISRLGSMNMEWLRH